MTTTQFLCVVSELEQKLVRFERVAAPYDPVQELGVSKYPRIILADRSGRYAPLFKDFIPNPDGSPTVPTLYENAPRGGSPFINPSKDRTNQQRGRPIPHQVLQYCECCKISFSTTVEQHNDSTQHMAFVDDSANWEELDAFIVELRAFVKIRDAREAREKLENQREKQ